MQWVKWLVSRVGWFAGGVCASGEQQAKRPCYLADWHCEQVCGKLLACGRHHCDQVSAAVDL